MSCSSCQEMFVLKENQREEGILVNEVGGGRMVKVEDAKEGKHSRAQL